MKFLSFNFCHPFKGNVKLIKLSKVLPKTLSLFIDSKSSLNFEIPIDKLFTIGKYENNNCFFCALSKPYFFYCPNWKNCCTKWQLVHNVGLVIFIILFVGFG